MIYIKFGRMRADVACRLMASANRNDLSEYRNSIVFRDERKKSDLFVNLFIVFGKFM
ncbi:MULTISPECIES: hypothetical protein [Janthinobacterium]|uniref:hypothetical protein n=1 Tax=Janthinobacterium TaxID=29580 RepID=UPI001594F27E|nr:hypothetical protein [Janthinobacterium sp. BJB401]NVI85542.1 hypothetical protein [Janthinobacterium sp. BJB401]